jgi:ferredoxin
MRLRSGSRTRSIDGTDILVSLGRTPNNAGIGLDKAGIEVTEKGHIRVNERLETTAPSVCAMCNVIFSKSGRQYVSSSADTLLTIAERHGIEVASNCRVGQCGSCATRVLDGDVEMETEEGLDAALRAQGYRLLCVGRARGPVTLEA